MLAWLIDFSEMPKPALGYKQPFISAGTQGSFRGRGEVSGACGCRLLLVQSLRMSGAVPLLPLHAVMAWTMAHFNHLKPSGFFTYHQVQHSTILHGARFALSVLYGSQNRQRPLLYTSLTDWFL